MSARLVRLVDRGSGQVCMEYDLSYLREAEVNDWYLGLVNQGLLIANRLEWPDRFEENDL